MRDLPMSRCADAPMRPMGDEAIADHPMIGLSERSSINRSSMIR
jgi:hypothetical protein